MEQEILRALIDAYNRAIARIYRCEREKHFSLAEEFLDGIDEVADGLESGQVSADFRTQVMGLRMRKRDEFCQRYNARLGELEIEDLWRIE